MWHTLWRPSRKPLFDRPDHISTQHYREVSTLNNQWFHNADILSFLQESYKAEKELLIGYPVLKVGYILLPIFILHDRKLLYFRIVTEWEREVALIKSIYEPFIENSQLIADYNFSLREQCEQASLEQLDVTLLRLHTVLQAKAKQVWNNFLQQYANACRCTHTDCSSAWERRKGLYEKISHGVRRAI